ncbi:alkylated DNA repair protein (DNA oxidative demethylase) [Agrobacterium larrymoorei]|uniref:Alkylated DNA repair protein (DNA oxidative demethylase) n=2 Tax=Agrobacterium larrymoorei TaxID=160699 RepID=A0AAJ2ESD8_9HYPH|nr:alkylated DNA repair protein (DNA oxidative demethylase) [Agrobacterium larrymoorei]
MMNDLFAGLEPQQASRQDMADGAVLMRGRALSQADQLIDDIHRISSSAPFRHMVTPGGFSMSVAMTNCGTYGWVTDRRGYRYERQDPLTGENWSPMPESFLSLAVTAAHEAGYPDFTPNACLINRYQPGAKMALHQDKDERDFSRPIVSVSLGLPVTFQFGGLQRTDPVTKYPLQHGDVVVWGGASRLFYHGVLTLKNGIHEKAGAFRYNLTFRHAVV